jgi:hypothetical protein
MKEVQSRFYGKLFNVRDHNFLVNKVGLENYSKNFR